MVNVLVVPDNGCEFDSLVDFLLISNPIPQDPTNIREKTKANSGVICLNCCLWCVKQMLKLVIRYSNVTL